MTKEDFKLQVRLCAYPEDFAENQNRLDLVAARDYEKYIWFLKLGVSMNLNLRVMDLINDLSKEIHLSDEDIIHMIPKFRQIIMILEAHSL